MTASRSPCAPWSSPESGGRRLGLFEHEVAVAGLDPDRVALGELALEQLQREAVDELALDHPLQRPGAVDGVVAEVAEKRPGVVGQFDLDPALVNALETCTRTAASES